MFRMDKYELKKLIKILAKIDNIDDQQWILSTYKNQTTENNYRNAQAILAMYNAKDTFEINYTKDQFKWAYNQLQ
jgi:hypothetical protein